MVLCVAASCRNGKPRCRPGGHHPSAGTCQPIIPTPQADQEEYRYYRAARSATEPLRLRPVVIHVASTVGHRQLFSGIPVVCAGVLFSDEDIQLARRLLDPGLSARYDSRIVVFHQIQASRLTPEWLLSRLYWQGASTVLTRRLLQNRNAVWRELPRRLLVVALFAPASLWPQASTTLLATTSGVGQCRGRVRPRRAGWGAAAAARRIARPASAVVPTNATREHFEWTASAAVALPMALATHLELPATAPDQPAAVAQIAARFLRPE